MPTWLLTLPAQPRAWLLLALSAFGLFAAALYFQFGLGLEPCVKCVYQRVAVLAVGLSALLGWWLTGSRWQPIASVGWLIAAGWGLLIAYDHHSLQQSANAFFAVCESIPNFPAWLPLHEWLPALFNPTGLCGDIDWAFLGLSMPAWMVVVFAVYSVAALVVIALQLVAMLKRR